MAQSGKVRALAVGSPKRISELPDVPTLAEAGRGDVDLKVQWIGAFLPAGTPAPIAKKLETALQQALAEYLVAHPEHHRELPAFYQERRDYFASLLKATRFRLLPAPGTYFQLADYSEISALPDVEFARWLTIEHGVATIPVSVFYERPPATKLVRFCFAKENATLDAAAARLRAL